MGCCLPGQHLAQRASTDQDNRAADRTAASLRHQLAISSFGPPFSCCILSLVHEFHQNPLSTFTTWKTFTPIL